MSYTKTVWKNGAPPGVSADLLNKIEKGISEAHELNGTGGVYDLAISPIFVSIIPLVDSFSFTGAGTVTFNSRQTVYPGWFE
ncbi:MAG TPA: hypothetical protein DCR39_00525 [Nitrospiraceae bacterium]|nr:hypothetical protein [Nitrospiraceae bacterium]